MPYHNDTIIKTQEDFFRKILYLSIYCKGSKRLLKVCVWEGAGDRTELKYFDPHSYGRQHCVFLVLLMLNRRPRGPLCWLMAFFTTSYQHLLWTPRPQGLMWLFVPHLVYNSSALQLELSDLTELYNSPRPTQSPTRSSESQVWSSLSGNNCHVSSGVSVYECTMVIFLPRPISSANFRPRDFLS